MHKRNLLTIGLFSMLLPACGLGGDDPPLYVVLEELVDGRDDPGVDVEVAVTTAGTMFVREANALRRREANGAWTGTRVELNVWSVLGPRSGELIVAHADGCDVSSDEGATWQFEPYDWFGGDQVKLGQLQGDDAVLALVTTPQGLRLLESAGGCSGWVERSNAAITGFAIGRTSFVDHTIYTQLVRVTVDGATIIRLHGEDSGRQWVDTTSMTGLYQPMAKTPDGLVLSGSLNAVQYADRADATSEEWRELVIPGPERELFNPELHVDHQGYIYFGARYRSIHPLTRANPGRALALAGPGCQNRDSISYSDRDPFESQVVFTNQSGEGLLVSRHDSNGNVIPEAAIAAGQTLTVVSRKHSWWEVHDDKGICYRLFEHTSDDQQVSVEAL